MLQYLQRECTHRNEKFDYQENCVLWFGAVPEVTVLQDYINWEEYCLFTYKYNHKNRMNEWMVITASLLSVSSVLLHREHNLNQR
jgi:hypothetical protein